MLSDADHRVPHSSPNTGTSDPGVLSFIAAPNFEAPTDAGANNVYDVQVQVSDGTLIDTQAIAVTVTNQNEAPTIISTAGGATTLFGLADDSPTATKLASAAGSE